MAVDVFETLVEIFKINQNLVTEYAAQGPLYQLFYLFFFPTIFIILFIWILVGAILGRNEHKGLRLLLAIGVYAFIILQGLYNWFVNMSKFWLFGLIFLGFIYFITYRGGRGGGGGAHGKTLASTLSFGKFFDQINPLGEYRGEVEILERDINSLYEQVVQSKQTKVPGHYQELMRSLHEEMDRVTKLVPLGHKNPAIRKIRENYKKAEKGDTNDPPKW